MPNINQTPTHPGSFVRQSIIPEGMSVKEAAERLGVGRPALSNFLNGKSALSSHMALRLAKAFGANQKQLLEMQADYDRWKLRSIEKHVAVRAFVPSFLTIKASQIEDWADSHINSRTQLAVLLRKLVHSTGTDLRKVDFPGYDNAERKGSDGLVEAGLASPWIPEGRSYWEFGTDKKTRRKADDDYSVRLRSVSKEERSESTFVFVTPRNWPGKNDWEREKRQAQDWRAVRVFDASDLEQWLEQSVPAQMWLAEVLAFPITGFETLDSCWGRWADVCEPPLTSDLFAPSITTHGEALSTWLTKPCDEPFVVAADSRDEALAYLACVLDTPHLAAFKDIAAVITSTDTLRRLLASPISFIPIVQSDQMERELGDAHRRFHCIVVHPRNAADADVKISLDLLSNDSFRNALRKMGLDDDRIDRLALESGRSPTVLRRRLSKNPAIKTPLWASNDSTARSLVPMTLAGSWQKHIQADQQIVSAIANRSYEEIEEEVAKLLQLDDAPVWAAGHHRGVVSKVDALFAIAKNMTSADIDRFFVAADLVLSELDPSLDLPEENRWAASLYGREREYSRVLRDGVCETLVLLSIHGNALFEGRLGLNIEVRVANLIKKLLTPLTHVKLRSYDVELPRFAEAAPNELLSIIEGDLQEDNPVLMSLLRPVNSGFIWASPLRTGLLWALECMAWRPQHLSRVCVALARLSQVKIDDNWMNKPIASLQDLFRSWMPQTAAPLPQRIKALEMLVRLYPDVGWQICIEQIKAGSRIGRYTYRPRWRSDASGVGQMAIPEEMANFTRTAIDLLISWQDHDENTLGGLIECLYSLTEADQERVWSSIDSWRQNASEGSQATLRERIRQYAFTRTGHRRKLGDVAQDRARQVYESLCPHNPVIRHRWLFAEAWVQESRDDIEDEDFDFQKRAARVDLLRREAITEIWSELGFNGILQLLEVSGTDENIGYYTAFCLTEASLHIDFVRQCLAIDVHLRNKAERCVRGFLQALEDEPRTALLHSVAKALDPETRTQLFLSAPFREQTWRTIDEYGNEARTAYWSQVSPAWHRQSSAELDELVGRLLEVRRPRAAFGAVRLNWAGLDTYRLKQLLHDVAQVDAEPSTGYRIDRYDISEALDSLESRPGITIEEIAQLEFTFIAVLDGSKHGIRNLERQIAQSPLLFAQAVALAYKRSDTELDPLEWRPVDPEQEAGAAAAAYQLLRQMALIPGTDDNGVIDAERLVSWLVQVRRHCSQIARAIPGDHCLGQLLSKAPTDPDQSWPCEAVCEAIESIASPEIGRGFSVGVYNSRGVHTRSEGGDQERALAQKYREWADHVRFDYPFMATVLEDIVESYERDARYEDSAAKINKRLRY